MHSKMWPRRYSSCVWGSLKLSIYYKEMGAGGPGILLQCHQPLGRRWEWSPRADQPSRLKMEEVIGQNGTSIMAAGQFTGLALRLLVPDGLSLIVLAYVNQHKLQDRKLGFGFQVAPYPRLFTYEG